MQQVLQPPCDVIESMDWRISPQESECHDDGCRPSWLFRRQYLYPNYRHVYKNATGTNLNIHKSQFQHLEQVLPGFQVETGFACSWGSLLQLAPSAELFAPNLFTELLPTLRDLDALVLAVYVRTGFTDHAARAETKNETTVQSDVLVRYHERDFDLLLPCGLQVEQEYLKKREFPVQRIVWIVVSDSEHVKRYVVESHSGQEVKALDGSILPRQVLVTSSHGRHSRPARNPSTTDFAESIIDWHLIGESDAVIINSEGYTYATTAAMRTNRPVYLGNRKGCSMMHWLRNDET